MQTAGCVEHLAGGADDGGAAVARLPQHLVGQACFADAGLAFQQQEGPAAVKYLLEPFFDHVQFDLAADKDA